MWTNKLGSSVVATDCYSLETLKIIRENCPKLESLFFHDLPDSCGSGVFPYNLNKDFKSLNGLCFNNCCVTDNCINQFIADKALEDLDIRHCPKVTGDFLNTINLSSLKSLALLSCYNFDLEHLICADLGELTSLIVNHIKYRTLEVQEEIQYMLDGMPKLEYLEINNYHDKMTCHDYGPLSRLTRLQHLLVSLQVPDEGVEAILQNCKELTSLHFSGCAAMTGCSVAASVCRWGSRLRSLTLEGFEGLDDEDVVTIIRGCPELMSLELMESQYLTPNLPELASESRHAVRPGVRLRLQIDYSLMSDEVRLCLTPNLPELASEARHAARPGVRLRLQIDYSLMSDEVRLVRHLYITCSRWS
ncbi:F-box/LRR-repeat protein 2-like [Cydia fagiglandana]|uniref:F-box/LRR-repeat protein 2-like n=1 Tax=Cydia fagiglandana TaxID=1458189 RepID=UPI002FEE59BA